MEVQAKKRRTELRATAKRKRLLQQRKSAARVLRRAPPAPEKIAVVSLDYDGCGDILFTHQEKRLHQAYAIGEASRLLQKTRGKLQATLDHIQKTHARCILMVGSARQSVKTDRNLQKQRQIAAQQAGHGDEFDAAEDGLCFRDYERYAAATRGIALDKCLLADTDTGSACGTAWADARKQSKRREHTDKLELLQMQMDHAAREHGDAIIDYYFFDDLMAILTPLRVALKTGRLVPPRNVRPHLVKFDWYRALERVPDDVLVQVWPTKAAAKKTNHFDKSDTSK
jgi:hypothetical protein